MIDESTEFGARVARDLRDEIVVWMTTVTPVGSPLSDCDWPTSTPGTSVIAFRGPGWRRPTGPAMSRQRSGSAATRRLDLLRGQLRVVQQAGGELIAPTGTQ